MICSSYRTHEKQTRLFEKETKAQMANGLSEEDAKIRASNGWLFPEQVNMNPAWLWISYPQTTKCWMPSRKTHLNSNGSWKTAGNTDSSYVIPQTRAASPVLVLNHGITGMWVKE